MRDGSIACSLLRRDAWEAVGGFPDLRAAEDGIFLRRLAQAGLRTATAPEARLQWRLPPTLIGTFRRLRRYSRINVLAGEEDQWHHGVARQWAVAAPFAIAGLRWRPLLAVPALGFAARVGQSVLRRRDGRSLVTVLHPVRLAGVGAVLLTCDLATFVGWVDALRDRRAGRAVQG